MNDERRTSSINDLMHSLGRMEGKLDTQTIVMNETSKKITIQNGRIGKLEQWRNGIIVVIGVFAFFVSVFGNRIYDAVTQDRWRRSDQVMYEKVIAKQIYDLEKKMDKTFAIEN